MGDHLSGPDEAPVATAGTGTASVVRVIDLVLHFALTHSQ